MRKPDCPACGSTRVIPIVGGVRSDRMVELDWRGEVALRGAPDPLDDWGCESCGHRWPHSPSWSSFDDWAIPAAACDVCGTWVEGSTFDAGEGRHLCTSCKALRRSHGADDTTKSPGAVVADEIPDFSARHPSGTPGSSVVNPFPDGSSDAPTLLRRTREARGMTLTQASAGTRIKERYLRSLESGAPIEDFPAPAYARFFLLEYAKFLELEERPLLKAFEVEHPSEEPPVLAELSDPRPRGRLLAGLLAMATAAVLVVLAVGSWGSEERAGPAPPRDDRSALPDQRSQPRDAPPKEREPRVVRAVLELSAPSWVQAVVDGAVTVSEPIQPGGDPLVLRAQRALRLTLGNAGAVDLRVNGDRVRTGDPGELIRLSFRLRDGRIHIKSTV